jgi:hypothetical protein
MQRGPASTEMGGNPSPGGLGCVANTGVTNASFGSVAMIGLKGRFFGCVASKGVRGLGMGNRGQAREEIGSAGRMCNGKHTEM